MSRSGPSDIVTLISHFEWILAVLVINRAVSMDMSHAHSLKQDFAPWLIAKRSAIHPSNSRIERCTQFDANALPQPGSCRSARTRIVRAERGISRRRRLPAKHRGSGLQLCFELQDPTVRAAGQPFQAQPPPSSRLDRCLDYLELMVSGGWPTAC